MDFKLEAKDHNGFSSGDARPTNETVRDLISVCTSLIELLTRETKMLEDMRPGEIGALQDEKATLALSYQQQTSQLTADPNCLKVVEPVLRDELKTVLTRIEDICATNEKAIQIARATNERVIRCIVDAVSDHKTKAKTYGPDGAHSTKGKKAANDTISFRLDEQL